MTPQQIWALVYLTGALYLTVKAVYNPHRRDRFMGALAAWALAYILLTN